MSLAPSSTPIRRTPVEIFRRYFTDLCWIISAWVALTGVFLTFDQALGNEMAWQPARFERTVPLAAYGIALMVTGAMTPLVLCSHSWRLGGAAALLATTTVMFLGITLAIEAVKTGQGPIGAVNCVGLSVLLATVVRLTIRDRGRGA